jgi:hypothetical protein
VEQSARPPPKSSPPRSSAHYSDRHSRLRAI